MRAPMHCSTGTVRTAIGPHAQPSKIPSLGQRGENIAKTDPISPSPRQKKKSAGSYNTSKGNSNVPARGTIIRLLPVSQRSGLCSSFLLLFGSGNGLSEVWKELVTSRHRQQQGPLVHMELAHDHCQCHVHLLQPQSAKTEDASQTQVPTGRS